MTKNDAITTFGKFLNIEVKEHKSTRDAPAGEVIATGAGSEVTGIIRIL